METIIKYQDTLKILSQGLRSNRINQNDTQASAAARIGVSLSTYKKMEQGSETTQLSHWISAAIYYGDVTILDELFPHSLFDLAANRQRVSRCKR